MLNKLILSAACILLAVSIGCNPANHPAPPPPVVGSDTIILKSQNGFFSQPSGSYINLYDVMQVIHSTPTDSSLIVVHLDTSLTATDYHMDMHITGLKPNTTKFDVKVNCVLNLVPPADSTGAMFIAQCKNGKDVRFDTVLVKKDDKSFTIHVNDAIASYYYIVLWGLNKAPTSTVTFQDVMVTVAKDTK